jgi:hypothetical protein
LKHFYASYHGELSEWDASGEFGANQSANSVVKVSAKMAARMRWVNRISSVMLWMDSRVNASISFAVDQVAKVGAGKVLTGVAGAGVIQGGKISAKPLVFQVPAIAPHQGRPMASQPGGNHTVEQIYPGGNGLGHFFVGAHPHQVAGLVVWQAGSGGLDDFFNQLRRFPTLTPPMA